MCDVGVDGHAIQQFNHANQPEQQNAHPLTGDGPAERQLPPALVLHEALDGADHHPEVLYLILILILILPLPAAVAAPAAPVGRGARVGEQLLCVGFGELV